MAKVKVTWDNLKSFGYLRESQKGLIKIGFMIEREVKLSMSTVGTGRIYLIGKNRNIVHRASAPDQPPAVLTGRLRSSITTAWTGGARPIPDRSKNPEAGPNDAIGIPGGSEQDFKVVIGTNVDYGVFLELGTSRMAPRPFLRPAFEKYRASVIGDLKGVIRTPGATTEGVGIGVGGEFETD